jgi:hypothetical protein
MACAKQRAMTMRMRNIQKNDGRWVEVPTAATFSMMRCGDESCRAAHVLLEDDNGVCFAELMLSPEQARSIAKLAAETAEAEGGHSLQ